MKTLYVPVYDWNAHYDSVEECVEGAKEYGDLSDGEELQLVRLTVHACTTYRMVNGKAVPVSMAFPMGVSA